MPAAAVARGVYNGVDRHNIVDVAAQVAYYFLFSLFPFLFFVATMAAYLPLGRAMTRAMASLSDLLPHDAFMLVQDHVRSLITTEKPRLLTVGLFVAIWSASRGVDSVRTALNLAYGVNETRPWWRRQVLAVAVTVCGAIMVLAAISVLIVGGSFGYWLAERLGFKNVYMVSLSVIRWPITTVLVMLVAAMIYFVLPDVKQKFKFITPGSIVATLFWLMTTWVFGQYVSHWGSYGAAYGSLGGVVILLTWFYLSVVLFLVGGELNAVLEHASTEGKAEGARDESPGGAASNVHRYVRKPDLRDDPRQNG